MRIHERTMKANIDECLSYLISQGKVKKKEFKQVIKTFKLRIYSSSDQIVVLRETSKGYTEFFIIPKEVI